MSGDKDKMRKEEEHNVHTLSGYHEPAAWLSSTSCTDRKRAQQYDETSLRVILAKQTHDMMDTCYLPLMKSSMICMAFCEIELSGWTCFMTRTA